MVSLRSHLAGLGARTACLPGVARELRERWRIHFLLLTWIGVISGHVITAHAADSISTLDAKMDKKGVFGVGGKTTKTVGGDSGQGLVKINQFVWIGVDAFHYGKSGVYGIPEIRNVVGCRENLQIQEPTASL